MELLWFTLAGIIIYLASDWILRYIEFQRGERFKKNRSIIFFLIFLPLILICFELIRRFGPGAG